MAHVKLENVRKIYDGEVVAVQGATFEVEDGEFVVLVGPSGCGKSTTLRMIAGLEAITSGSLFIGRRLVNNLPPKDRDIAMVFQNYALYPHMTAYENMAFGLKLRKFSRSEIDRRVKEAARTLSIESLLDRKPKSLSGGQRQRVALGRAIVREPQVFLFDEPLSNLDAKLRASMRTELSKLHSQLGATMIYVTHDQVEAMTMGDRIVVLKDGHIQQVDTPLQLYDHPANRFVAGFIGNPPMNLIEGRIVSEGALCFRTKGLAVALPVGEKARALSAYVGKQITLGIRPEDIYWAGRPEGPAAEVRLTLEVVEPMGSEVVVYAGAKELKGKTVIARLKPQALPEPDTQITLAFALQKLHFFEIDTGEVISQAGEVDAAPSAPRPAPSGG